MSSEERDVLGPNIKPSHYQLDIYSVEFGGSYGYSGTVTIDLAILKPTNTITLNAKDLKLKFATISGQDASAISYEEKIERATITFPTSIAASEKASLLIKFDGTINNDMNGFYRSKYKPIGTPSKSVAREGEFHLMYSTQFESCDARRAFPCFDEPNLKATFAFSIEIPDDLTALSNMNEIEVEAGSKPGSKIISFEKSPSMSTYLYAWAVAQFEYVETFTERKYNGKELPVRVYTTPGYKEQSRFSLEVCAKVVDYYSEIFQLEYPLPKVDLVAAHEFSHGAMENWGLITYRLTAILFDEKTSDAQYKKRVAYVVAHELAHQWFGNLVTMDWWSELWLNEGFATWVGWLAIDHFFPAFETWSQFVAEDLQMAQELDGLRSSHAVEVAVKRAEEVEQIFDVISYRKGSSVLRMLVAHLTIDKFLAGIAAYLRKHAYGNATTNDLWAALAESSGKDVKSFMDPWIRKIGFPVLTVAEEPGQISVKQSRFLSSGDVKDDEDETLWWIPLGLEPAAASSENTLTQLTTREETLRNVDETFYKLNRDQVGFYRTNYPPARLAKLGAERNRLSVEDRIGLVADAAAMAVAGLGTTAGLLTLLVNFHDEDSYAVWTQLAGSLADVRITFSESEVLAKALDTFTLRLFSEAAEKIGWEFGKDEGFLTGQLRSLLIWNAGRVGHQSTINEAKRRFTAYVSGDKESIHPSLRSVIFRLSVKYGGQSEYDAIKNEFGQTTSIDGKEVCLRSLGTTQDPELAHDFLRFIFSDAVAVQDLHFGAVSLAINTVGRKALWAFVTKEWDTVWAKMSSRPIVMARFVKNTLAEFATHEMEKEISDFFKDKDQAGWDRAVTQVVDTVNTKAKYRERDELLLQEWLKAHGFA